MASQSNCREAFEEAPNGSSLCALINGEVGWLMFLRASEDAGFSSRNPNYVGPPEANVSYTLDNGQVDSYPASWAFPIATVEQALAFFRANGKPPSFIIWHDDSGDGTSCGVEA
jgi:hypothetical protein